MGYRKVTERVELQVTKIFDSQKLNQFKITFRLDICDSWNLVCVTRAT